MKTTANRIIAAIVVTVVVTLSVMPLLIFAETESPVYGDSNNDGVIDTTDALNVMRAALGISGDVNTLVPYCDVDGNGSIDTTDALVILRAALDIEHVHQWHAHTITVHHDAWDEEVAELHYVCATCGDVGTQPPSREHIVNHLENGEPSNYWTDYVITTVHHAAYDETVTDYYYCTICGATQQP